MHIFLPKGFGFRNSGQEANTEHAVHWLLSQRVTALSWRWSTLSQQLICYLGQRTAREFRSWRSYRTRIGQCYLLHPFCLGNSISPICRILTCAFDNGHKVLGDNAMNLFWRMKRVIEHKRIRAPWINVLAGFTVRRTMVDIGRDIKRRCSI